MNGDRAAARTKAAPGKAPKRPAAAAKAPAKPPSRSPVQHVLAGLKDAYRAVFGPARR